MATYTPIIENIEIIGTSEQREKWIAALRSGDWEQNRYGMCDPTNPKSACCLHVAAIEIDGADWEEGVGRTIPQQLQTRTYFANMARSIAIATDSIGERVYVIEMNDREELTFQQIADLLEGKTVEVNDASE